MKTVEVQIPSIHDVKRAGVELKLIENIDVVNLRFRATELFPREQRETQIDGGRNQGNVGRNAAESGEVWKGRRSSLREPRR